MFYLNNLKSIVPKNILNVIPKENYDIVYLLDIEKDKYIYISPPQKLLGYDFQESDILQRIDSKGALMRMQRADGSWVWIRRTAITYKENNAYRVLGLVKDASDDKNTQKILIEETESKQKVLKKITNSLHSSSAKLEKKAPLTKREFDILRLLCEGLSTKIISSKLGIADNTVNEHRKKLHKKLNVHNTAELVSKTMRERFS
jgi:DNA-binding CsgD family transcriptional regulator